MALNGVSTALMGTNRATRPITKACSWICIAIFVRCGCVAVEPKGGE